MSSSDYNRIISTVNSVSSNFSFVPDLNNVIVIDTSNNRIGINNTDPEYSLDISGNVENKNLGIITPNLTICGGYVHSSLIPKNFDYTSNYSQFTEPSGGNNLEKYSLGDASNPWYSIHCISGDFQTVNLGANTLFIDGKAVMGMDGSNIKFGFEDQGYDINLSAKFQDISINGNINFVGPDRTITSQSNIILDPSGIGDDTGTVIIKGDLNVLGAQTTITSQTLEVSDNIIIINKGNTNNDDAGIEIDISSNNNQRLIWSNSDEKWKFIDAITNNLQNIEVSNINLNQLNIIDNVNNNDLSIKFDNNSRVIFDICGIVTFNQKVDFIDGINIPAGASVSTSQTIGGGHIFNTIIGYNTQENIRPEKGAFSNILVRDESTFQNNIIINGNNKLRFTDVEGNSETPLLSGNFLSLDVSKNLIVHEDVSINGRLDISGGVSFNSNVDITGNLEVQGDASFNSNVDITGNLKTNNIEELNYNSGVTINNTLIIENNVIPIWQRQQLGQDIDGEAQDDNSGYSVSLNGNGNILAIGAPYNDGNGNSSGHVRVYKLNDTSWEQLGQDIDGEALGDHSGWSVSLNANGNILAIGAPYSSSGHVRVYEYLNDTSWVQLGQDIDGEAANDQSGRSVSLNAEGNILAIGAHLNDDNGGGSGHVRVYQYDTSWVQLGQDIDGEAANDQSGYSVSLNAEGNILAIGAPYNDGYDTNAGHVRVYKYDTSWVQLGQDIDGEAKNDYSGWSVSLNADGNILAIGAPYNDGNGNNSGHVRVYKYDTSWVQLGQDIDGEAADDQSGFSVSLNGEGNILAIGANYNDGYDTNAGHVRVYEYLNDTSWVQLGVDIDGEAANDHSGYSVSLSSNGNILAIGARINDGNGTDSGHVRVYKYDTLPILPGVLIRSIGEEYDNTLNNRCRLEVNGDVSLNSNVNISGDVSLNSNVNISRNLEVNYGIIVGANAQNSNAMHTAPSENGPAIRFPISQQGREYNGSGSTSNNDLLIRRVNYHGHASLEILANFVYINRASDYTQGNSGSDTPKLIVWRIVRDSEGSISDDRFKHNEQPITGALNIIRKLDPQVYDKTHEMLDADYNGPLEEGTYRHTAGLIAQEVANIPELAFVVNIEEENDNKHSVEYEPIFVYNIAATKELDAIVQSQQTEINDLKAENTLIKSKLNELLAEAGKATI